MLLWDIRFVTFITNCLLLVGYALLFTWIQTVKFKAPSNYKLRTTYLIVITIAFLALFHFSSELSIIQAHSSAGYGWTFINFQVATIIYALMASRQKSVLFSLALVLLVWWWWLPRVTVWPAFYLTNLVLMAVTQRFGVLIGSHRWLYYPYSLLFMAPFFWANYLSLRGIDVGWPWEMITTLIIMYLLWKVHYLLKGQRIRQALLMREARTDKLTQLNNFRVFNEDLLVAYAQYQETGRAFSMYTFDIDHFKHINDRYGHLMGNRVLERVAQELHRVLHQLPYQVTTYRTGGEEFSFLLTPSDDAPEEDAMQIATMVQQALGQLKFYADDGTEFHISVSLGQDCILPEDQNYMDIYSRADKNLYQSKHNGRNQVTVHA